MTDDPRHYPIDSHRDFVHAVHDVTQRALEQRARRMRWIDPDFIAWPLEDAALLQRLDTWLRLPLRELSMLAGGYEDLRRRGARFGALYRLWSHAITARAPAQEEREALPSLLWVENTAMVWLADKAHWRGWVSIEPTTLRQWAERGDALVQRGQSAFPVTTLGL